ncbi:hypothetical protein GF380_06200 [Candidatus Uhrbacteria bacterium]|nr:hypothetical protein [Candidatus Uhrbacteria bacterium]
MAEHGDIIEMKATGKRYFVFMNHRDNYRMVTLGGKIETSDLAYRHEYRIVFRTRQMSQ